MYKELSPCQFPNQYAIQRYSGEVCAEGNDKGRCFLVRWFASNLLCRHIAAVFGPIPMFVSSVTMVVILNMLDTNSTPLHQFQPAKSPNMLTKIV